MRAVIPYTQPIATGSSTIVWKRTTSGSAERMFAPKIAAIGESRYDQP